MMIHLLKRLYCRFNGHARGRTTGHDTINEAGHFREFACPRCGTTWTRRIGKGRKQERVIPESLRKSA